MNGLSIEKRAEVLSMLVKGSSMRSTSRHAGVTVKAIGRLLTAAGKACKKHHDKHVRGRPGRRNIQCDEPWSFVCAKEKMTDVAEPWDAAGSVWTFTSLDTDSRLIVSYHASTGRNTRSATKIMRDLRSRLDLTPNIATDQLKAYWIAANKVFGPRARLTQSKGTGITSHVERHNNTIRNSNRRYTRRTIALSKKQEQHRNMLHLMMLHYIFVRIHSTLDVTPAMEVGIDDQLRDVEWIVGLIDADTPPPKKPGPKVGTKYRKRRK